MALQSKMPEVVKSVNDVPNIIFLYCELISVCPLTLLVFVFSYCFFKKKKVSTSAIFVSLWKKANQRQFHPEITAVLKRTRKLGLNQDITKI